MDFIDLDTRKKTDKWNSLSIGLFKVLKIKIVYLPQVIPKSKWNTAADVYSQVMKIYCLLILVLFKSQ